MRDHITTTITFNGITMQRLVRDCGGLIVIKGKPGYVYSTDEHQAERRKQAPGVYHSVRVDDPADPYGRPVDTLIPGITVSEFRAAFDLQN